MPYRVLRIPHPVGAEPTQILETKPTLKAARRWAEDNGSAHAKPGDRIEVLRVMSGWNAQPGPVELVRDDPAEEGEPEPAEPATPTFPPNDHAVVASAEASA